MRVVALLPLLALAACAQQAPTAVDPAAPGFLEGVWHGFIFPIAWIISLFKSDVAIYAVPNDGGWYDFGISSASAFLVSAPARAPASSTATGRSTRSAFGRWANEPRSPKSPLPWEREGPAAKLWEGEDMRSYDEAGKGAFLRARQLRRASTDAEKYLWRALRSKLPQFKWRRQMPIGPYVVDFACFAEKIIVELDGGQHAGAVDYDARRTAFLQYEGYRVLRFWNNDALNNTNGVLETIAAELSSSPSRAAGAGPSLSQGRGKVAESV